jgi:hypothetical protein
MSLPNHPETALGTCLQLTPLYQASPLEANIVSCVDTLQKALGPLDQATVHGFRKIDQELE